MRQAPRPSTWRPSWAEIRRMRRTRPRQLKLGTRPSLPLWTDLPQPTRDEILRLLVLMLRAHVQPAPRDADRSDGVADE